MAAALRFAARRICGRALQQPPQPYFSAVAEATIKEEQRLLLPRVSHGGSSLRRFSAEAQNHLKNSEHGAVSAANPTGSSLLTNNAQTTPPPPLCPRVSVLRSALRSASPLLEASTSASRATSPATKPSGGLPWALLFSPRAFSSTPPAQQSAGDVPAPSAVDHKLIMPEDKFHKLADDTIHDLLEKLEEYGDSQQMDGFDIDYGWAC